jgi:serine/threonine protein kinase
LKPRQPLPSATPAALRAVFSGPARIGPYPVERQIGHGAMGAVYLARDTATNLPLAIKTLALGRDFAGAALDEAKLRFSREAHAAGRLTHPGIVTVFGCGQDADLAWIAMEHLPGGDLTRYTTPPALLSLPALLRIAARVAHALAYAHTQGVVHRDIKPANVMVDLDRDSVKVTDFGIARIADASRTRTGMVLGTPSFMSPEQMLGNRVDGRSDLYSLGVMLFQLLCGRLPHEAASMAALMAQIAHQRAPDLHSLRPQAPAALAVLVSAMLEKRPEMRPADGNQIARELRLIADGLAGTEPAGLVDIDASPPPAIDASVKSSRHDPGHNQPE